MYRKWNMSLYDLSVIYQTPVPRQTHRQRQRLPGQKVTPSLPACPSPPRVSRTCLLLLEMLIIDPREFPVMSGGLSVCLLFCLWVYIISGEIKFSLGERLCLPCICDFEDLRCVRMTPARCCLQYVCVFECLCLRVFLYMSVSAFECLYHVECALL
jgi:hypothetical protein